MKSSPLSFLLIRVFLAFLWSVRTFKWALSIWISLSTNPAFGNHGCCDLFCRLDLSAATLAVATSFVVVIGLVAVTLVGFADRLSGTGLASVLLWSRDWFSFHDCFWCVTRFIPATDFAVENDLLPANNIGDTIDSFLTTAFMVPKSLGSAISFWIAKDIVPLQFFFVATYFPSLTIVPATGLVLAAYLGSQLFLQLLLFFLYLLPALGF